MARTIPTALFIALVVTLASPFAHGGAHAEPDLLREPPTTALVKVAHRP